ncbi:MAG TPA: serine hydrolase domain-containing protein [Xanthobacteraceae bacterium]
MISRRDLLVGAGAAGLMGSAGAVHAQGAAVRVWPGKTEADITRLIDGGWRDGLQIVSLSLYGTRSAPLYAALMARPEKPARQRWSAALSPADLPREIERKAGDRFAPALIAAVGPPDNPRFAVVFEPQTVAPLVRVGLTSGAERDPKTIQHIVQEAKRNGRILRSIAPYGTPAQVRFATILAPNDDKIEWQLDGIADAAPLFRARLKAQTEGWCRLKFAAVAPDGRYLSLYHHDSVGPWTLSESNARDLEHDIGAQARRGLVPISLQAAGARADATRFATIFAKTDMPAPRQWNARGPLAHAAIDDAMQAIMTGGLIRQAGLAIVHASKLVFARGYTFAQPDWPVCEPTTTFRLASLSKTIAALGIYQHVEAGRLRLDDRVQDILHLRTVDGGPPRDPRFNAVTIDQLLAHNSGLDTHVMRSEHVRAAFAAAHRHVHFHFPITTDMANAVVASTRLVSDPGTKYEYNNCAYYLLGQVLARLGETATATAAQQKSLFAPLGITRIRQARSLLADQPPDEARYRTCMAGHIRILPVVPSVMTDARPLVPLGYGHEEIEIHEGDGGMSAAMPDLARLIAIMLERRDNPALRGDTIRQMLANAAKCHGHGFDVAQDRGNGSYLCFKGGALASSWSLLTLDGDFGFCVVWSGGVPPDGFRWSPLLPTVMREARRARWSEDLFPQFGMPSLT